MIQVRISDFDRSRAHIESAIEMNSFVKTAVVLCLAGILVPTMTRADDGEPPSHPGLKHLGTFKQSEYYASVQDGDFIKALITCHGIPDPNGRLVAIESAEEDRAIAQFISKQDPEKLGKPMWTSGAFETAGFNSGWVWMSSPGETQKFKYQNWEGGKPPNPYPNAGSAKVALVVKDEEHSHWIMRPNGEGRNPFICEVVL